MSTRTELRKKDTEECIKLRALQKSYIEKLKRIGENLGFDTRKLEPTFRGTILCEPIECIWRLKNSKLKELSGLPIAIFEIVYCENLNSLQEHCRHIIFGKPALAVFVPLEERIISGRGKKIIYRKRFKGTIQEQWLKGVAEFLGGLQEFLLKSLRITVWTDKEVDELYSRIFSKQSVVK